MDNKTRINFQDIFSDNENDIVESIDVFVDSVLEGSIKTDKISGEIYWYVLGMKSSEFSLSYSSFDEAKQHCKTVLSLLFNAEELESLANKKLIDSLTKRRKSLSKNKQVEISELKRLVCCAYIAGEITESRGASLLDVNLIEFRKLIEDWRNESPEATKTLVIIRGVPGDGKTSLANMLDVDSFVAADDYPGLYINGEYQKDLQKKSHEWCFCVIENCMKLGENKIAVNNTFAQDVYYEPYIELAKRYGYSTHIVVSEAVILPSGERTKSAHNIPAEVLNSIRKTFEPFNRLSENGITLTKISEIADNLKRPNIMIFDMDFTIKKPLEGKIFCNSPDDFELTTYFEKWISSCTTIKDLPLVYIVSNQRGVEFGHKTIYFVQQETTNLLKLVTIPIRGVYLCISEDRYLFYDCIEEIWVENIFNTNLGDNKKVVKPGIATYKDISLSNPSLSHVWIIGDSHNNKNSTDFDYFKNCVKYESEYTCDVNLSYVPIEMLALFWEKVFNQK